LSRCWRHGRAAQVTGTIALRRSPSRWRLRAVGTRGKTVSALPISVAGARRCGELLLCGMEVGALVGGGEAGDEAGECFASLRSSRCRLEV